MLILGLKGIRGLGGCEGGGGGCVMWQQRHCNKSLEAKWLIFRLKVKEETKIA